MNNDVWKQQQQNGSGPSQHDGNLHSGHRLDYQQGFQQYSPTSMPSPQGPPPYSPMPQQGQQQWWPAPQSWPSANKEQGQGWLANTMQMVQRWSGRVAAVAPV